MTRHLLYKTTCLVTGKFYVGMHSTENIDDGYLGSGVVLHRSINKHGKAQHVREILEELSSREALIQREIAVVTEELLKNPFCLNKKLGGHGGFDHLTIEHRRKSHATVKKLRAEDPAYREQHSASMVANGKKTDHARAHSGLRERYKDPEFKERQRQSLMAANARLVKMREPTGKRRKIEPALVSALVEQGWALNWK